MINEFNSFIKISISITYILIRSQLTVCDDCTLNGYELTNCEWICDQLSFHDIIVEMFNFLQRKFFLLFLITILAYLTRCKMF